MYMCVCIGKIYIRIFLLCTRNSKYMCISFYIFNFLYYSDAYYVVIFNFSIFLKFNLVFPIVSTIIYIFI